MNEKLPDPNWIDPDDAPELTSAWFATATHRLAGQPVPRAAFAAAVAKRGRPVGSVKARPKRQTTLRLDAEVLEGLRATGKGWQTLVNDTMRQWLKQHQPDETRG